MVLVMVFASVYLWCRYAPWRTSAWMLALLLIPIAMLLGPDLIYGGIRSISARYLTPSLLVVLLLASYFLSVGLSRRIIGQVLTGLLLVVGSLSCFYNARLDTVWTKGINEHLRQIAEPINAAASPLVVGNQKGYNAASLLALSILLKPEVKLQLLAVEGAYAPPPGYSEVFLFDPSNNFRTQLEKQAQVKTELVFRDRHLQLWKAKLP